MKSRGSTPELPSILAALSSREVSGTPSVEVKFVDIRKNTSGEGAHWLDTDAEVRKCGEQTGLDTLVVHTVNDECQTSGSMLFGVTPNGLSIPPGEYGRKVKTQRK